MKAIKVLTPAKINLTLEILGKRPDGFHEIQSIMQTISLYDYLTVQVELSSHQENKIVLSGNSQEIPYDQTNLIHRAALLYLNECGIIGCEINVFIEKNIPVAAGLAGGSSNAAGMLYALNEIFNDRLSLGKIDKIASQLGSDVNFCFYGGTQLATSRGEILKRISTPDLAIVVVKPRNLGISAREAYCRYAELKDKPVVKNTQKMIRAVENNSDSVAQLLNNDLESVILPHYTQVSEAKKLLIKSGAKNAIMSGSGPSVFGIFDSFAKIETYPAGYDIFSAASTKTGVGRV